MVLGIGRELASPFSTVRNAATNFWRQDETATNAGAGWIRRSGRLMQRSLRLDFTFKLRLDCCDRLHLLLSKEFELCLLLGGESLRSSKRV